LLHIVRYGPPQSGPWLGTHRDHDLSAADPLLLTLMPSDQKGMNLIGQQFIGVPKEPFLKLPQISILGCQDKHWETLLVESVSGPVVFVMLLTEGVGLLTNPDRHPAPTSKDGRTESEANVLGTPQHDNLTSHIGMAPYQTTIPCFALIPGRGARSLGHEGSALRWPALRS
jgi:hypothetical protein